MPAGESYPHVEFIKRAGGTGPRLGVFAASFNPVTVAHVELVRRAREQFSLDEVLALAGRANADKSDYECPFEERLEMLTLAFADDARASIGISSHAYFVDMIEALGRAYPPETDLHFIVGFDTFERVLDLENKYTKNYYREFAGRREALDHLLAHSRLIVAGRGGAGQDEVRAAVGRGPKRLIDRTLYLETAADLGERSATEVRARAREGLPVTGLVPPSVERYIQAKGLYKQSC